MLHMIGASLFIIRCTARNRLRARLKRLREPRYLVGAVVGLAYIYFGFFARLRPQGTGGRRRGRGGPPVDAGLATLAATAPSIVGVVLLAMTAVAWLIPFDSGLLQFSNAETQFLLPAPVPRRALLLHRMLRSQLGMLFGSIVVGVVMPGASGSGRLRVAVGVWLLLSTAKVYFTGISLARARLGAPDRSARRVAWLPLGATLAALAIVVVAVVRALLAEPAGGAIDVLNRVAGATGKGPARIVLWPFAALASPLFAPWPGPYLLSVLAASAVLVACAFWVVASDEAFQEAAEEIAARKDGGASRPSPVYRARATAWPLATSGRPEMVFAWKAALQTVRLVDKRSLARLLAIFGSLAIVAATIGQRNGLAAAAGAFSLAGAVLCVLIGPQAVRIDMRQDLQHLELLKTWPIGASAVVRGEIIWPGVLITGLAWILIASAAAFATAIVPRLDIATRLGVAGAALVAAPALVLAQLAIHNGAALLFPAWVPLGHQRPRGLDAMGQRIIMLGGTWIALIVLTLPGVLAGAIVWVVLSSFVGPIALVPGAIACAIAMLVEVLVVTEILAPVYERLDLLAVERSE